MELETSRSCELVDLSSSNEAKDAGRVSLDNTRDPVHFIGVGGIGMSALARLMLARGRRVSGSDKSESPITHELKSLGARIYVGHDAAHVADAGAVVISTAITSENPERAAAEGRAVPVFHRSEVLAWLCANSKTIAVSGTHGKTTTTGMIGQVLIDGGLDPSIVVGGIFPKLNSNARVGQGAYFVAEADESDRSHSSMRSHISVVTNIEPDHLENYPGGMKQILDTMASFANLSQKCVVCLDDPGCKQLLPLLRVPVISYGSKQLSPEATFTLDVQQNGAFDVFKEGKRLGTATLSVPGMHNKMNALCTMAVALQCGLDFDTVRQSIENFGGVERRFQILGTTGGVTVVDDYGHHPTEVRATMEAAKQFIQKQRGGKGRVVAVFQPHQPGRLRDLWAEFCDSFKEADLVLLADIYVARGGNIEGVTSERFAREIKHSRVIYLPGSVSSLPEQILPHVRQDDLVLTIGAGDITNVGKPLLSLLESASRNGRIAE